MSRNVEIVYIEETEVERIDTLRFDPLELTGSHRQISSDRYLQVQWGLKETDHQLP